MCHRGDSSPAAEGLRAEEVCYTDLVFDRVNEKLGTSLSNTEVKELVASVMQSSESVANRSGKNWYISEWHTGVRLTINASTLSLITVDLE
ncbi:DUF3781 domain-containing protein [Brevibacterium linens]|uniref:DUF3781 domain-containing protein n=1 Tax=Brevibacterium linens TaxID=1703 RepID=UPI003BF60F4B